MKPIPTCAHRPAGMRVFALAFAAFLLAATARAGVTLPPLFSDNAVLQRDKPVPVWGRADPGEKVTIAFAGQTVSATAAPDGRWLVTLAPMPASAEPCDIIITSTPANPSQSKIANSKSKITNVLVGEVWLCSGQSNMELAVSRALNPKEEAAAANFPLIRHFKNRSPGAVTPQENLKGEWDICAPGAVTKFSAAAYFFARELHQKLGVPIGLINSSWGGTTIEVWMSKETLLSTPPGAGALKRWDTFMQTLPARQTEYEKKLAEWTRQNANAPATSAQNPAAPGAPKKPLPPDLPGGHRQPAALYNGLIAPLIPCALRGVIWYQGESNHTRRTEYKTQFAALIRQWRADFRQGDIPFYFVQLANFSGGTHYAFIREAQAQALALPNTGMAVAIDIGESKDIHPRNKQEVGRRLALNALAGTYGDACEFSGPQYAGMTREGESLRIKFTHATGLKTKDAEIGKDATIPGFVIAGADQKYFPAEARIEGETIVVRSDKVKHPVAVRYAWAPDPPAPLCNAAGLPAAPFRSDDWIK